MVQAQWARTDGEVPAQSRHRFFSKAQPGSVAYPASLMSQGYRQPQYEAEHSLPSNEKVKNVCNFMTQCIIKHKNSFSVTFYQSVWHHQTVHSIPPKQQKSIPYSCWPFNYMIVITPCTEPKNNWINDILAGPQFYVFDDAKYYTFLMRFISVVSTV